jgi:hypothetical protein
MPRGRGRARGRYNPAYRRRLRPRVAQEPAKIQPPEPQQFLPNPPLQLQPIILMLINIHCHNSHYSQVPLGEIDNVELSDKPLLFPGYNE